MDTVTFQHLYRHHRDKLFEAWNHVPSTELDRIDGDLEQFLLLVARIYKIPRDTILHELDAVQNNIATGIDADYAPPLPPDE